MKSLLQKAKVAFARKKKHSDGYDDGDTIPRPPNAANGYADRDDDDNDDDADDNVGARYMDDGASTGKYSVAENDRKRSMNQLEINKPSSIKSNTNPYLNRNPPTIQSTTGYRMADNKKPEPPLISSAFSKPPTNPVNKPTTANVNGPISNTNLSMKSDDTLEQKSTGFSSASIVTPLKTSINNNNQSGNAIGTKPTAPTPQSYRPLSVQNWSDNNGDIGSRIEIDYPIENILVDANIPSSVAIKINDVVEKDRLGNAFRVHRYTFEPDSQNFTFSSSSQGLIRHREDESQPRGRRHIREIPLNNEFLPVSSRPQETNPFPTETTPFNRSDNRHPIRNALPTSVDTNFLEQLSVDIPEYPLIQRKACTEEPIFYYTARALHYDPMRSA